MPSKDFTISMVISIICPILNEERYIADTIESFLSQQCEGIELEILLVDGMSTDNTRIIIQQYQTNHRNLRLLDNPNKKTPFAFNIGLKEAKGNYVAILGAHCRYMPNYVEICYNELIRTNSVGCSGQVVPTSKNQDLESKLVRGVLSSPFGVSGYSFRTIGEGYVHSVNFPVFEKSKLAEMGGYNTDMHRNQDNAMNQKLIDSGYKLFCTAKTSCNYFIPDKLNNLFKYAFKNGYWNIKSLTNNSRSMKIYHFVPLIFTFCLLTTLGLGTVEKATSQSSNLWQIFVLGAGLHLIVGCLYALKSFLHSKEVSSILLPVMFFTFHFMYGLGSIISIFKK